MLPREIYADSIANYGGTGEQLAFDHSGNLWVAEALTSSGGPRVSEIFPDGGRTVRIPPSSLKSVTGVAVDSLDNVYVSDGCGNGNAGTPCGTSILRLSPDGGLGPLRDCRKPGGYRGVGPRRYLRRELGCSGDRSLRCLRRTAGAVRFRDVGPAGLAFDPSGNLYVGAFGSATGGAYGTQVFRIDPSGQETLFSDPGIPDPLGLAFDPQGTLWVTYYNSLKILRFGADGSSTTFPGGWIGDESANGIVFNAAGDLFTLINGGRTTLTSSVIVVRGAASLCH